MARRLPPRLPSRRSPSSPRTSTSTPPARALASRDVNVDVAAHPRRCPRQRRQAQAIISPPMKSRKHKGDDVGASDAARAARDLCGDLGEPKAARSVAPSRPSAWWPRTTAPSRLAASKAPAGR